MCFSPWHMGHFSTPSVMLGDFSTIHYELMRASPRPLNSRLENGSAPTARSFRGLIRQRRHKVTSHNPLCSPQASVDEDG